MDYPVETFTDEERALLAPHFTNLDRPVFALVNLPETVKGALFARYSRYQGTLRRLYLDEFVDNARGAVEADAFDEAEGERARKLYERIFLGYGDDSVAQLGGAHIACEWVSNVMTKVLQRGRLAAYLEQSTRYIAVRRADRRRAAATGTGATPSSGPSTRRRWTSCSTSYSRGAAARGGVGGGALPARRRRAGGGARRARSARRRSTCCAGCCPRHRCRTSGIFASGQAYEQLLLRLFASPLPEARDYACMILEELKEVMPSFVARVERPERGGEWISYLEEREQAGERWAARLGLDRATRDEETGPAVRLLSVAGRARRSCSPRCCSRPPRCRRTRRARRFATSRRTSARRCWPSWSASARTAATAPAAASRRSATASRSCPTTAPSATSSATGC